MRWRTYVEGVRDEALVQCGCDEADQLNLKAREAVLPHEGRNNTPRNHSSFFSGELANGAPAIPALRSEPFRHDLSYESKLVEPREHRIYLRGRGERYAQQLAVSIDLRLGDSGLAFQSRQHGRQPRASAEARCCASGESVKSEDDIGRHDTIVESPMFVALERIAV